MFAGVFLEHHKGFKARPPNRFIGPWYTVRGNKSQKYQEQFCAFFHKTSDLAE
jgi:hypothetical protein